MPRAIKFAIFILIALALLPPKLIMRLRATPSDKPRVHLIQDMDNQPRYEAQHESPMINGEWIFADGRAMRRPVAGTVAVGELSEDEHFSTGAVDGQWATTFPDEITINRALLDRGRERYDIYCSVCHGYAGYGDGIVHQRAAELVNMGGPRANGTTWVQPKSLHETAIVEQPVGQLYNSIRNGVRTMPAYAAQIPVADRWAIVAYMRALQRSQRADVSDIPMAERMNLPEIDLMPDMPAAEETEEPSS